LNGSSVSDAGVEHLKELTGLKELRLDGTQVSDAGLAHLKELKGLTSLDVRKTRVTAKGLAEFHAAVPACKIEYDGGFVEAVDTDRWVAEWVISRGGRVWVNSQERIITNANTLPRDRVTLNFVHLNGAWVTDAGLVHLKGLKSLTRLRLSYTQVSDAGLESLKEIKGLTVLELSKTMVSDTGLVHLKELKNLTSLDVQKTMVTVKGLEAFRAAVPACTISYDGGTIEPKK
jgi:hypothetical protein